MKKQKLPAGSKIPITRGFATIFPPIWCPDYPGKPATTGKSARLVNGAIQSYPVEADGKIVCDELVGSKNAGSQKAYPELEADREVLEQMARSLANCGKEPK